MPGVHAAGGRELSPEGVTRSTLLPGLEGLMERLPYGMLDAQHRLARLPRELRQGHREAGHSVAGLLGTHLRGGRRGEGGALGEASEAHRRRGGTRKTGPGGLGRDTPLELPLQPAGEGHELLGGEGAPPGGCLDGIGRARSPHRGHGERGLECAAGRMGGTGPGDGGQS